MRRLPDSDYSGSFVLPRFTTFAFHCSNKPATPEAAVTTDTSDQGTQLHRGQPPLQPLHAWRYGLLQPGNRHGATTPHRVPDYHFATAAQQHSPRSTFTALTLEEYQLLSQQQATPLSQHDYTRPTHCIPGDYNSTLLSISLPEAANVLYYHTTSLRTTTNNNYTYVIVQLQVEQQLFVRHLTSGQFVHFTRDYISYIMSIQNNFYLPTTQHPQLVYKVECDMSTFTDTYSLKNNYIWNYCTPQLLPDLLHYLNNRDQLHDFQHKAITTILCKSIQYYGFALLTMTNLTQQHKTQLHCFLRDYDQHMTCSETDDERLRGAPNYMTSFFTTHYFATLDSRLQMVSSLQGPRWALHA